MAKRNTVAFAIVQYKLLLSKAEPYAPHIFIRFRSTIRLGYMYICTNYSGAGGNLQNEDESKADTIYNWRWHRFGIFTLRLISARLLVCRTCNFAHKRIVTIWWKDVQHRDFAK